jgi:anti-sigma factor RsiW
MTTHPSWETLNDYVDGVLAHGVRTATAAHLDGCEECREQVSELRSLIAAASAVPDASSAPDEVWAGLRAELERRKLASLPFDGAILPPAEPAAPAPRSRWWTQTPSLAAAALILVAVSSTVTAVVMRSGPADRLVESTPAVFVPAAVARADRAFAGTLEELEATLTAGRSQLAPETIAVLERSLSTIDEAIQEARTALSRDPANAALADVLQRNYRQKLELLRRAAELVNRT